MQTDEKTVPSHYVYFIRTIVRIMHSKQMLATVYFEILRERILTYTRLAGLNVNT
jgi:hypothetical protein